MALTDDLISQFVKITNDKKDVKEESTVYGTIKIRDGRTFVQLDGANDEETLTPVTEAASAIDGERVTVMIKNHTAIVTGNLSSPLARSGDIDSVNATIHEFQTVLSTKVSTEELEAERARIADLEADNVVIKGLLQAGDIDADKITADILEVKESLTAAQASIENLETTKLDAEIATATYATIENLEATNVNVHNLEATYGDFEVLTTNKFAATDASIENLQSNKLDANTASITYAKIADLDAINAEIDTLQADVADIDTLIFGSATGDTIQTSFANSVIAQLGDAQIKSAMIESVSADKITAGDIITNNVRVRSEDGSLIISDETMQISDSSRVRVQIGKDAIGDYSINIWDAEGNLMFSKGGITDSAIKDAIIRNDMVSDTANISAHKLDIDSLFEEINGSTNTIKSTRVYLDDEAQTLDLAFKEMETDVSDLGETVASQGTQLSVVQGKIESKVWQQDIDTASNEMSTQYSTLKQEVDSISATVASHTTEIDKKADSSTVTTVNDRVTTLESNLTGFKSTVSSTYATKTEMQSIEVGGRNLFRGYDESEITLNTYKNVGSFNQFINCLTFDPCETVGETYTISLWAKSPNGETPLEIYNRNGDPRHFYFPPTTLTSALGDEWNYFTYTFTNSDRGENYSDLVCNRIEIYAPNQTGVLIKKLKVERGTKATDWTPAPEDIQANIDTAQAAADAAQATANQNAVDMASIVTNVNADISNLQAQIDGSITTWFYEVAPSTNNEPAINWTTTDLKNVHLGDLYYDTITGYCYRWQVQNNTYSWQRITDTDVTKALSDAQAAQDTADQKRRVFYTQPTPPYDKGDLWVQGSDGDILRCKTAKASGQSYSLSDWVAASKYTDDTVANTANDNALAAQTAADNAQADVDDLENDVVALEQRVTTAETSITQNTEAITLRATKTELTTAKEEAISTASSDATTKANNALASANANTSTLLKNYSTTSQMNSAIELKANSITSSVSETYATKTALSATDTKAANAANAAANAQADIDNLEVGGRNLVLNSATIGLYGSDNGNINCTVIEEDYVKITPVANGNVYHAKGVVTSVPRRKGIEYTFSFEVLTPTTIGFYWYPNEHYSKINSIPASESWQKVKFTYTQTGDDSSAATLFGLNGLTAGEIYYYRNIKLETGNVATAWSPAPEDVQEDVTALETRVTSAESKILQNADAIELRATTTEVSTAKQAAIDSANANTANLLKSYSTTSEMESAIKLKSDSILSSVSSTYATKTALETTNTNVTAAQASANAAQSDIDNLEIGGRNLFSGFEDEEVKLYDYNNVGSFRQFSNLTIDASEYVGKQFTVSFWAKSPNGESTIQTYNRNGNPRYFYFQSSFSEKVDTEWKYFTHTFTNTDRGESYTATHNRVEIYVPNQMGALVKKIKVEMGNRPTDWTPAPEDVETEITSLDTRVTSAESSITQLSNKITSNVTETTNLKTRMSTVEQTATGLTARLDTAETDIDTAQSTANTAKTNAATAQTTANNAAKTATNYLNFSNSGLVVGDMTTSSLGKNVLIDSDSVDIRNGTNVLASFGANKVTLGQNSADSVIDLCDGAGKISALISEASTSYPEYDSIEIASQEINTSSQRFVTDVTNSYNVSSTPAIQNDAQIYMLSDKSSAGSFARMEGMCTTTSTGAEMSAGVSAIVYDTYSTTRLMAYAHDSTDTLNRSNMVNVYPHKTTMNKPLYINGTAFTGENKVLWSGGYYMSANQTATLSEAISAQANGIVLVWSYYVDGANDNSNFHSFFVPKHFVSVHNGKGLSMFLTNASLSIAAGKYVYISDTTIKGYSNNNANAAAKDSGLTASPKYFVLRYVIGV